MRKEESHNSLVNRNITWDRDIKSVSKLSNTNNSFMKENTRPQDIEIQDRKRWIDDEIKRRIEESKNSDNSNCVSPIKQDQALNETTKEFKENTKFKYSPMSTRCCITAIESDKCQLRIWQQLL